MSDRTVPFILKPLAFLASLGPAAWLVWAALTGHLSANPLSDLTNETGVWTLRFLCVTLAITPLRRVTGWNAWIKFRRMAGLYTFFYGTLHLLSDVVADRFAGLDFQNGIVARRAPSVGPHQPDRVLRGSVSVRYEPNALRRSIPRRTSSGTAR